MSFRLGILFAILLLVSCASNDTPVSVAAEPAPVADSLVESRGVWLAKNEMLESREALLARLDRFREAGLNTVYVHTQLRGYVMYPGSRLLPQWPDMKNHDPDILAWLIPAIHERGMRAEAWMEYGLYAYWTRNAKTDKSRGAILDLHPDLTAIDAEGHEFLHNEGLGDFYSMCPVNPKTHEVIIALNNEVLDKYPFDGINLDRIRFTGPDYCYCDYCKAEFEKDTGMALVPFPAGSDEGKAFNDWRKEQLREFVAGFSKDVRRHHPGRKITAAVMPPYMIDEKAQDWPVWIEDGSIDAALPMLYLTDITKEVEWLNQRLGPGAMVFWGLDAGNKEDVLIRQVEQCQRAHAKGVALWYSGTVDPYLARLGETVFMEKATSPLYLPEANK